MDADVGYLAGLVEGEGCFYNNKRYYTRVSGEKTYYDSPKFALATTDSDVLDKCQRIAGGVGTRHYRKTYKPHHSPIEVWQINKKSDLEKFARLVYPHLCRRRRLKIIELGLMERN